MKRFIFLLLALLMLFALIGCKDLIITLTSSGTKGAITLSWEISDAKDVNSYYIYRGTSPTSLTKIATVAAPGNTYTDTAVADGVPYYYHVTAFGRKESKPSNQVCNMHGTRLTGADTNPYFTATVDNSPYVIEGNVSLTGDLYILENTQLYVLPGARVVFSATETTSIYVSGGLIAAKGLQSNPIYFSSTGGGYELRIVAAAEGSGFDYTEFKDLAGAIDSQAVIVSACSPIIRHCRFIAKTDDDDNASCAAINKSGATIANCYFQGLDLSIEDSILSTPEIALKIESNIFVDNVVALRFSNYAGAAPEAGVIQNNAFECNGTSAESFYSADLTIVGWTDVACDFLLGGNYFFRSDIYNNALTSQVDFKVYNDSKCPNQTFNFDNLLTTRPTGIGPGWGTLPF